MFTGIVEEIGTVINIAYSGIDGQLTIKAKKVLEKTKIGDSIATNGVCLTVTNLGNDYFTAYVMGETMRRSNLKHLKSGSQVNLERACLADTRLGGHIVSGHVDCCGIISEMKKEADGIWIKISPDNYILKYIAEKGSIAIDGISLTVANVSNKDFSVCLIPHTSEETTLTSKKCGDEVNLESDILAKYIERLMSFKEEKKAEKSKITAGFLAENGFI